MKINFIYMGSENLGIEYLSSSLKNSGHSVDLIFDPALFRDKHYLNIDSLAKIFDSKDSVVNKALAKKPDIIGFSVFTHNYQWALAVASAIKKLSDIPVIFGGIHPTILPQEVISNNCVDMICIGEGEDAIVELLGSLKDGRKDIRNIWFKKDGSVIKNPVRQLNSNLDTIPFPDKSLFEDYIDMKAKYMVMATRGCPFNCSYCSISTLRELYKDKGPFVRFRSAEKVIEEIVLARSKYDFKSVDFHDDVFTINLGRMEALLKKYVKEVALPFTCLSHPLYMDTTKARLLKESGCCMVQFGIQSTNEISRNTVLCRPEKNSDIEKALDSCKATSLPFQVDHIFGIPGEAEKELVEAVRFYIKHRPQKIGCFWLSYFPKTRIIDTALQRGLIKHEDIDEINNGLGKILHFGGSIKDSKQKKLIKGFEVVFKIIPIAPVSFSRFIIKTRFYRYFYILPFFVVLVIDIVGGFKHKRHHSSSYIKYYFRHISDYLRGRFKR